MLIAPSSQELEPPEIPGRFSIRLDQLVEIANSLGLASRPVKLELEDIRQLTVPCILHWNMNHFVVLEGFKGKDLLIVDPAYGRRRVKVNDVDSSFTGVALELDAGPNLVKPEKVTGISLASVTGSITGLGKGLLQVFAIAAFLELLGLLVPQFLQLVVDQVLSTNDEELLTLLGVGFSTLILVRTVADYMRSWLVMWIGATLNMGWTGTVFSHLLRLPLDYFQKRNLGDVVSRFGAMNTIQQTLTTQFVVVIIDGIMTLMIAVMLLIYNEKLALVSFISAISYSLARVMYFRSLVELTSTNINVSALQHGMLIETLRGMQTIRLNNRSAERSAKFANATAEVVNTNTKIQRLTIAFTSASGLVSGGQKIAILWIGAALALKGELTAGMLMAFVAYSEQFTVRFAAMVDYIVNFRMLRLHGERLADIVLTAPEKFLEGTRLGTRSSNSIEFREVSFRYSHNTAHVLKKCSFNIQDGEVVAIVGPSGCGKSTLAKILLGVLDQSSGSILIGGVDTHVLGKREVRNIAASVLQDDELFSGSVMDNISFFDPVATLEKCQLAARKASIDTEIEAMTMGYQSMIGDMGATLSGGQKQRILLARAFYREPKILVLDEATSNLDLNNESQVCNAVRAAGVTTLIIAHRPQTIASADRAILLKQGQIVPEDSQAEARDFESEKNN
ncbi:peptidase domain-containing ABC transporter [Xanthomonas fragariae]|uniref:peptidase domain-containing ABC transporter n=1 Tax=Xanthomonas fragariae TaxID=48664 RepID=UPI001ABE4E9F|nr:peptidase domain-containing ABC transporter [Xanthomonas fragariae]UKR53731.1 peptidase domain-containing ABC transporter [Xanthomonas fragariae]